MRFDRLDLNLLVALNVLIEVRNVSEAGRRLHLSQPAVTGALNRLRDYFEDELLVQNGRRMVLTTRAEELRAPIAQALALIRSEITCPAQFDPATASRRFTIVASDYAYTILLSHLLARVAHEAPGISFDIATPGTDTKDQFARSEIDLFFTVDPFTVPRHPQLPLWRDTEVVISWREAGYEMISENDFFASGHAVAMFGPDRQPSRTDAHLAGLGRQRHIEVRVPSFSALPQAVVGTRRLATMHRLYAEHFAAFYPIKVHDSWASLPPVVEVAQWNSSRSRDPGVQWLVAMIKDCTADLPHHARVAAIAEQ